MRNGYLLLTAALMAVLAAAENAPSPLIGVWQGQKHQAGYTLTLNGDGKGTLNGNAVQWVYSNGVLRLVAAKGSYNYKASVTAAALTLSGNDLKEPLVFQRVAEAGNAAAALPVPGNPPLTQEMVDKGARLFEWLLDTRLTEEQHLQFQDSIARSWKTGNQNEIAGTLNVLKFHEDLGRKTEAERNAVREMLLGKFLEAMRAAPGDTLSRWVLAIYYSRHTPIANGNPPLTRQVADAYAEVNCFMIGEVLGGDTFKPGKDYKDGLAKTLAAEYPNLGPERQKEMSQLPLAWASIRLTWAGLSEAERAKYREQWSPGVRTMLSAGGGNQPAASPGSSSGSRSREIMREYERRTSVNRMLFNMNQDYIHQHVLSPGWTYSKYAW